MRRPLIPIGFFGIGGHTWLRLRERPERIVGRRVRFQDIECRPHGDDPGVVRIPCAEVSQYFPSNGEYQLDFERPFEWLGHREDRAYVAARLAGRPVSRVSERRSVVAGGRFGSGECFLGRILGA